MYNCMYVYVCVYVCIYIYAYTHMYTQCIYIYAYAYCYAYVYYDYAPEDVIDQAPPRRAAAPAGRLGNLLYYDTILYYNMLEHDMI